MSYQASNPNTYGGLPRRPASSSAQPPAQQPAPYAQPSYAQPAYPSYPAVAPSFPQQNFSGGYNPYGNMQYNPGAGYQTFGQSLFQQPQATPEGYSYSPTYNAAPSPLPGYELSQGASDAPNKRARLNTHTGAFGSGDATGAWRNCSIQGCKYVGSARDVEVHEEDRHLIYKPGYVPQRSEEEEKFLKRKGPPPAIEGTNITLQTEEDIAKWIAERKAKWPSSKRVAEKDSERKAAIERGEFPSRGGRGGSRGRGGRASNPAAMAEDWGRAPVEREFDNTRGRGRGRGRGSERGRGGRGDHGAPRGQDEGWGRKPSSDAPKPGSLEKTTATVKKPADAVVSGVTDYVSSEDVDSGSSSSTSDTSSDTSDSSESEDDDETDEPVKATEEEKQPEKPLCKTFAKTGKCKWGQKCHFSHKSAERDSQIPTMAPPNERKKIPKLPPQKRANPFDRPSMLGALLATPIQNTLSQLSQTIRFLVANNMLENVELAPGQAEDEEKERNKVVEVPVPDDHEVSPLVDTIYEGEPQV